MVLEHTCTRWRNCAIEDNSTRRVPCVAPSSAFVLEQICVCGAIAIPSAIAPSSALALGSALVFEKVIELERAIVLESDIAAEAAIPLESAIVLEGAIALAHAIAFIQMQLHWRVQKNLVLPSRSCANAHPNAILFFGRNCICKRNCAFECACARKCTCTPGCNCAGNSNCAAIVVDVNNARLQLHSKQSQKS